MVFRKHLYTFWNGDTYGSPTQIGAADRDNFLATELQASDLFTSPFDVFLYQTTRDTLGVFVPDLLKLVVPFAGLVGGASGSQLAVRACAQRPGTKFTPGGDLALKVWTPIANAFTSNDGTRTFDTQPAGMGVFYIGASNGRNLGVDSISLRFDKEGAGTLTAGTFSPVLYGYVFDN